MNDIFENPIKSGWRGTNCNILYSQRYSDKYNELQQKYFKYRDACPQEAKNREHYYVKSFIIANAIREAGFDTVMHLGFGHGRYLYSYKYFNIKNVMGIELPFEDGAGTPSKQSEEMFMNSYEYIIFKDYLDLDTNNFESIKQFLLSKNAILISEASLMCFLDNAQNYLKKYTDIEHQQFLENQSKLISFLENLFNCGFDSMLLIESNDKLFDKVNINQKLIHFDMGNNFKYDFSMNYDLDKFTAPHLWTSSEQLFKQLSILKL